MYEGLSFAAHRRSWQDVWEIVEAANRPNLGICLDSFNTLALEWADPYAISGLVSPNVDALLQANMEELVRRVPGEKIFFYQVAVSVVSVPPLLLFTHLSLYLLLSRMGKKCVHLYPLRPISLFLEFVLGLVHLDCSLVKNH